MPKKQSAKLAAKRFDDRADELENYVNDVLASGLGDQAQTLAVEAALIKLAASFERLMLDALVCAVNNDTQHLKTTTGIEFPKHLTSEVCDYIVTSGGYFDYRGRDGLIQTLKRAIPDTHYLVTVVKKQQYKEPLERLVALRNFAAHESPQSKAKAKQTLGTNLSAAGAWTKRQGRYAQLSSKLRALAAEIDANAPY